MKSTCWDTRVAESMIKVGRRILRQVYRGIPHLKKAFLKNEFELCSYQMIPFQF